MATTRLPRYSGQTGSSPTNLGAHAEVGDHGVHELHLGPETYEIEFPGLADTYRAWRAALPSEKRPDW